MKLKDRIKVICFDYDGTLVDYQTKMSEYTINALRMLKENGYIVALVSGRRGSLAHLASCKYLPSDTFDFIFGFNGAEYFVPSTLEDEITHQFDKETLAELSDNLNDKHLMLTLYNSKDALVNHFLSDEFMDNWSKTRMTDPHLADFHNLPSGFPKIAGIFEKQDKQYIEDLIKDYNDPRVDFYYSAPTVLEIVPKGVNKGMAIQKIMNKYNLKADEIMAVGDNYNDEAMLDACVGVIMENAPDDLKKESYLVADNVNNLGIYKFFKDNEFI